jgi:RNA polymerase sigma-70 factor, ECF subfamily
MRRREATHRAIGGGVCCNGDRGKGMNSRAQRGRESELIPAILAGDVQLYHELIRLYERSIYIVSFSCMKNERDAEEVVQETFIRAFRDLRVFRGDSKFSTWLIGIAINEARSRLRRQGVVRIASPHEPQDQQMPGFPALLHEWRELSSDVIEREEIRSSLQQAVEMLPNIYQQVFLLRDVEKLNGNDTAQILDIDTSMVKVTLHRARMMLQRLLAPKLRSPQT